MDWRNRALCLNIPTNIFFPGTDKQMMKRYWDTPQCVVGIPSM